MIETFPSVMRHRAETGPSPVSTLHKALIALALYVGCLLGGIALAHVAGTTTASASSSAPVAG